MSLPIQNRINERCRELGLRRTELVVRCGYKNISKGLRRLDQVYAGDLEKAVSLLRGLPKALQLSPEIVQRAVDETIRQNAAEADACYRASFEPHGYLLGTSDRPSQIFNFGITGGADRWLKIPLDLSQPPVKVLLMRMSGSAVELSASDLSGSSSCTHLTALDLAVAKGLREPSTWVDPSVIALRERGLDHERRYVEQLISEGLHVEDLSDNSNEDAVAASVAAMRSGVDVIVQPALRNGRWFGRPDVLRRFDQRSTLGEWSYQVVDTKLAKETRGGTILQLSLYSELLGLIQGTIPEHFEVVTPGPLAPIVHTFRINDFAAYFPL